MASKPSDPTPTEETRVWAQTTRKVNLGDYESFEVSVGASVPTVGASKDDRDDLYQQLLDEQLKVVHAQSKHLKKKWGRG